MSPEAVQPPAPSAAVPNKPARSFVYHAKLISGLTFGSRILGVVRESLAARYFGPGIVTDAFALAFAMPNLFRRLFGEGALSAAFIPLYSQALKDGDRAQADRFAAASVNLLVLILVCLTLVGEGVLAVIATVYDLRPDRLLALQLTAVMFPYVLLVCGAAFLGAILQVHRRFGVTAAAPIVLNVALIAGTVAGAWLWDLSEPAGPGQVRAIYLVSFLVLVAGVLQIAVLLPSLRAVGFRFDPRAAVRTPAVRRMIRLSIPVALGAGVLQLSVLLDKSIAYFLSQGIDDAGRIVTHFTLFGRSIPYPLESGATVRLAWAQLLYQFPLGVFAIAVATAIFPTLSADALDADRRKFRDALRRGLRVTLWEGLPASAGLVLVAYPAVQVIFEGGKFTPHDSELVARSLSLYAVAIWAFSLQQILSRAYYALHDTTTPLVMAAVTLAINLAVEIPLLWTPLAEAGMAAGTSISFMVQVVVMLWMLQRKTGDLELGGMAGYAGKLLLATALMTAACLAVQTLPFFPQDLSKQTAPLRLAILVVTGATVYIAASMAMGVGILGKTKK